MATWLPISGSVIQRIKSDGKPASGYVLKLYAAGTTDNIPMATDAAGSATANTALFSSTGDVTVSGSTIIPHIDQDYKYVIYPNQAAADSDTGASITVDNISYNPGSNYLSRKYLTGAADSLASNTPSSTSVGDLVQVSSYSSATPIVLATWRCTSVSASLPAGAVAGDVTGAAGGFLYVLNTGSDYYKFDNVAQPKMVEHYGAIGDDAVTDDKLALQAAFDSLIKGEVLRFRGVNYRSSGQLTFAGIWNLTLDSDTFTTITFDDAAIIGLLISNCRNFSIRNVGFASDENVTPLINLIKVTDDSPYFRMESCDLAFADISLLLADAYGWRIIDSYFANSNTSIKTTTDEGPNINGLVSGTTFGTHSIGSEAVLDIKSVTVRLSDNYFETVTATKELIHARSGCQRFSMVGNMAENCGDIHIGSSVDSTISGNNFSDVDNGVRCLRLDSSGSAQVVGNSFTWATVVAGVKAISGSTTWANVSGNYIYKADTGIQLSRGFANNNLINNCGTVGLKIDGGAHISGFGNQLDGNTVDIDNGSDTAMLAFNRASTITNNSIVGGLFGNSPKENYSRELFAELAYDPASLADGAGVSQNISCTYARKGDFVEVGFTQDLQGILLTAYVSADNVVTVRFQNETTGTIDLASGTVYVKVRKAA